MNFYNVLVSNWQNCRIASKMRIKTEVFSANIQFIHLVICRFWLKYRLSNIARITELQS
jgi:hypothetical protein